LLINEKAFSDKCYLVGGVIRDALLDLTSADLDIVVEGKKNALSVASHISRKIKITYTAHQSFGTYVFKVSAKNCFCGFDIATARKENYPHPAALPVVNFDATIKDDLFRRDFTINAMAVPLAVIGKVSNQISYNDSGYFFYPESVIDLVGGMKDLSNGLIRVIHNNSFIDDPTRIIRAARFAARFGFKIEKNTLFLAKDEKVKMDAIPRLSNARIGNELILLSKEKYPLKTLHLLDELGVVKSFFPDINLDKFRRWIKDKRNKKTTFSYIGLLSELLSVVDIPSVDFLNKYSISRAIKKEVLSLLRRSYG